MAVTAVLVTLKLTGILSWSWWWITVPLWWDVLLVGSVILLVIIAMIFVILYQSLVGLLVKE